MYAKVKLHYIELQQRRLATLEMCSTAKDMVTGPTGLSCLRANLETVGRLALDPRPSVYVTCALYTLNVYFYLGTYVGSALCTRTNRTYLWSAGQRGARPSVYPGTQRLPSRDVLAPAFKVFTHAQLITRLYVAGKAWVPRL